MLTKFNDQIKIFFNNENNPKQFSIKINIKI